MPEKILLSHGSGGSAMQELIRGLLLKKLHNPILKELTDAALIRHRERIAFTTDSFVVSPLFLRGADIGKLAVCGTVNDLVMLGVQPEHLSLGLIIEEGLDYRTLERIVDSIASSARRAGVSIVTGDLKVVERGAADKIFINTSGIGRVIKGADLSLKRIRPKDKIIVTGEIGSHGMAVVCGRKGAGLGFNIASDCASLNTLLLPVIRKTRAVKFMRDPTRGGVAATLNEIAGATGYGILIKEKMIPVAPRVRMACELLGLDPLYVANEGKALLIVEAKGAEKVLESLRKHSLGRKAKIIGKIRPGLGGKVVLETRLGTERIVDMPAGEILPRIC